MEGFSYVDIFATKGIEYLLVLGFLLALVAFWRILNKPQRFTENAARSPAGRFMQTDWFNLARGAYYHQGHCWARPESDEIAAVGVDDFAQKLLGSPVAIKLPKVGTKLEQGEKAWQLQVDSKVIDMLSPISGEVTAVNPKALAQPGLINEDPYEQGWLLKIRARNMRSNLKNLLRGKLALAWMRQTEAGLRRRLSGGLGPVLQDGGVPMPGLAMNLDPQNWEQIVREYFLTD